MENLMKKISLQARGLAAAVVLLSSSMPATAGWSDDFGNWVSKLIKGQAVAPAPVVVVPPSTMQRLGNNLKAVGNSTYNVAQKGCQSVANGARYVASTRIAQTAATVAVKGLSQVKSHPYIATAAGLTALTAGVSSYFLLKHKVVANERTCARTCAFSMTKDMNKLTATAAQAKMHIVDKMNATSTPCILNVQVKPEFKAVKHLIDQFIAEYIKQCENMRNDCTALLCDKNHKATLDTAKLQALINAMNELGKEVPVVKPAVKPADKPAAKQPVKPAVKPADKPATSKHVAFAKQPVKH
jgi:hypothetical protein